MKFEHSEFQFYTNSCHIFKTNQWWLEVFTTETAEWGGDRKWIERWPRFSKRNVGLSPGHLSPSWFDWTSNSIVLTLLELFIFPPSWRLGALLRESNLNVSQPHQSSLCSLGLHKMNSGLREEHTIVLLRPFLYLLETSPTAPNPALV